MKKKSSIQKLIDENNNLSGSHSIRSKAPLRLGFAGGGTDVSPFLEEYGSVVLNATIDKYAMVSLDLLKKEKLEIVSLDYDVTLEYETNKILAYDGQLDLIKGIINYFYKNYDLNTGFKMYLSNDAPPGSGLGSSSSMAVACVAAFFELLRLPLDLEKISNLAWQIERHDVKLVGGKQDQWAAAYGGFNLLEFNKNESIVTPLKIRREIINELDSSIIMGYIGMTRDSGKVIEKQSANISSKNEKTIASLKKMKEYAYAAKNELVQGHIKKFAKILDAEWKAKKEVANNISNEKIEEIYSLAISEGAWGGKISGAGGGGFMIFICNPDERYKIATKLKENNVQIMPFSFSENGVEVWRV